MTTPTNYKAALAETGLFEDLPEPSAEQVKQVQAKAASKAIQGTPRLLQANRS